MVYVDNMKAPFRGMKMSHMVADTTEELNEMADKIGVNRKWIQNAGTYLEHYDVCLAKRSLALRHGAQEMKYGQELARFLIRKKNRMRRRGNGREFRTQAVSGKS